MIKALALRWHKGFEYIQTRAGIPKSPRGNGPPSFFTGIMCSGVKSNLCILTREASAALVYACPKAVISQARHVADKPTYNRKRTPIQPVLDDISHENEAESAESVCSKSTTDDRHTPKTSRMRQRDNVGHSHALRS